MMKTYCLAEILFLASDLVLLGEHLNPKHFYRNPPLMKTYEIKPGSVAVIPNQKLKVHAADVNGQEIYESAVRALLCEGKNVYIIRHCDSDREFCAALADKFGVEDKVVYIDDEIDCIEFSGLIAQEKYVMDLSEYNERILNGIIHEMSKNFWKEKQIIAHKYIQLIENSDLYETAFGWMR